MPSQFSITDADLFLVTNQSLGADFNSPPFYCFGMVSMGVAATWAGNDGTLGTMVIQYSLDNTNWNDMRGVDGTTTLNNAADTQIWQIVLNTPGYIRASYIANNATMGTVTVRVAGISRLTFS